MNNRMDMDHCTLRCGIVVHVGQSLHGSAAVGSDTI